MSDLENIKLEILQEIKAAEAIAVLEEVRVNALGKKGKITAMMKDLGNLQGDARKEAGQTLNLVKNEITEALDAKAIVLKDIELNRRLASEKIDITLPVRECNKGTIHPINKAAQDLETILMDMGFSVVDGPEIEDDFHNFTALNMPSNHPARQMQDSFYLPNIEGLEGDEAKRVLRTQTSSVQIHTMQNKKPPLKVLSYGKTYRNESDATHSPMFHQIEGLYVDKNVTMAQLKGCLKELLERYFEIENLKVRMRPSFFPFTEPSAEYDIGCLRKGGELKIGEGEDWMEVCGCGMVNPKVLEMCGIDSKEYQGFAFGFGLDRMAMLKYGMPDVRNLFECDLRWLKHYGFKTTDK